MLDGGLAHERRHEGDTTFNLMGQSEDVIAPWSVGGFEVDLPDWRPQPAAAYGVDVGAEVVAAVEEKVANMFGSSLRLVSTKDGVFLCEKWCVCWSRGSEGGSIYVCLFE